MKLKSKNVTVHYRGRDIECEKMVYACTFCDYELHEKWMEKKLEDQLAEIWQANSHQ